MAIGSYRKEKVMKQTKGRPLPFGAAMIERKVNFSVARSDCSNCELLLYKSGSAAPDKVFTMKRSPLSGDVFFLALSGDDAVSYEYNFRADGEVFTDPYAKRIIGKETWGQKNKSGAHGIRAGIPDRNFEWDDDRPLKIPYHDVVAYSLHVRGFTMHPAARVKDKGTFKGLMEKIPYLTELGINQIQCMPVYEFEENGTYCNYWGYGPAYCFTPKSSYSVAGDSVTELKEMIKAFHTAGIEVVLDLPFTAETSKITIGECLRYYRTEYHVDGFILNPYTVPVDIIKQDPLLAGTKIMEKREEFQNVMRRFLKGDEDMIAEVITWLRNHSAKEGIFNYITNQTGFTLWDLVSYDGKHNEANGEYNQDGPHYNYSWNCGEEGPSRKRKVNALRRKQMRNAFFLLLTAQGTPCILAGDEFANSQKGNNNVYCQDNEVGWVDWSKYKKEQALHDYAADLIAFRKSHPLIHREDELLGLDKTSSGVPDVSYHGESAWQIPQETASRHLGVYYSASEGEEACFLAYNMHWLDHSLALPALKKDKQWYQVMATEEGVFKQALLLKDQKAVLMKARSTAIFIGK